MSLKNHPVPLEGEKITTASDMALMEKRAIYEHDATDEEYMTEAANAMFRVILDYHMQHNLPNKVYLLCNKGNNSGDAYSIGELLLSRDFSVTAYQFISLSESSPLCQQHAKGFLKSGGKIVFVEKIDDLVLENGALIIDGLFGTGFKGSIENLMGKAIEKVNQSSSPVIAIDIPSGIPGDTGIIEGAAIVADVTLYLGLIKVGHLYNQGFDRVGELHQIDFGMGKSYLEQIKPFGYLVNPEITYHNLPKLKRTANKYTVGQVLLVAGSKGMPGAAMLASLAALKSGAGIVRLFHRPGMDGELSYLAPEVIRSPYNEENRDYFRTELMRTKALLVGPGLGRDKEAEKICDDLFALEGIPFVIDADGLFFCKTPPKGSILTPHKGELARLLGVSPKISDIEMLEHAEAFANKYQITIVCKGAPTTVVSHEGPKIVIPYGNPGMASGGMGDALSGIILALVASGHSPREMAVIGATLHAIAGDRAKELKSMRSMTATDLIESLSSIFLHAEENHLY